MARSARKPITAKKSLLRPPVRIGTLDASAAVGRLRQLHEDAEDANIDRMPADDELFGALLYLEAHASALKGEAESRTAAIERVRLWEYLREQVDLHQAKAIEDARAVDVQWAELAPALAVNAPSAAYNKAKRLRATNLIDDVHGDRPVRRTPEAVLEAERQAVARAAAERRAEAEAERRHALVVPVARRLLEHRAGLDDSEDVTFWLDQIEAVLATCETATQMVSLATYVGAAVRALQMIERTAARPAATTGPALSAYAAAAMLTG